MMKVYVVTSGCYSDYGIEAVFSDREAASRYCKLRNADMSDGGSDSHDYRIEEWPVDEEPVEDLPNGLRGFRVRISKDGEVSKVHSYSVADVRIGYIRFYEADSRGWGYSQEFTGIESVSFPILARGEEQAIKIANEKRAQLVALGRWGQEGKHG
jgi:hypothetical protein